jgi:hypothetical protein
VDPRLGIPLARRLVMTAVIVVVVIFAGAVFAAIAQHLGL